MKILVENDTAARIVMGNQVMKEWVLIQYKTPTDSRKHLGLLQEALGFASTSKT